MSAEAYAALERVFEHHHWLGRTLSLLNWDAEVMMPAAAAETRGRQTAAQTRAMQAVLDDANVARLLDEAARSDDERDPWARANLREMRRLHALTGAAPKALNAAAAEQAVLAESAWREVCTGGAFSIFTERFEPLLDLVRRKADHLGAALGVTPFEGLMREHDPSASEATLTVLFTRLADRLPPLVRRIVEAQRAAAPTASPFAAPRFAAPRFAAPVSVQSMVCRAVAADFGFDFAQGRLDESAHPSTEGGAGDIRITTTYAEDAALHAVLGTAHECGHALYDMHLPERWRAQPVGQDRGMPVHEGVALFYEMAVARTKPFAAHLARRFTEAGAPCAPEPLAAELLHVHPGLIRIEADEASYLLHILLRWEVERALLDGSLAVGDLPEYWSARSADLLGVRPTSLGEGCLQDIHWALGLFGYFPSYARGMLLSAVLHARYADLVRDLAFDALLDALTRDLFAFGSFRDPSCAPPYDAPETGPETDCDAFLAYLEAKYLG